MTLRQMVNELQNKGYKVRYYVRNDGGIVVTSINNKKYTGKKGNRAMRLLLGEELSERRQAQLSRITRQRNWARPKVTTPQQMERELKRVQRKWRKAGIKGTISKRNLKKIIEERGLSEAQRYLEEMERHAEGKAYNSQIEGLIARLQEDMLNLEDSESQTLLQECIDLIEENRDSISPQDVFAIFDELYNFEAGALHITILYQRIHSIIHR